MPWVFPMNRLSCLCLIAVAFCLCACSTVTGVSADEAFVRGTLDRIERTFAPDKRLTVWETTAVVRNGKIVVQGKTDSAKALDALECALAKQQVAAEVEVSLLPNESPDVGELSWALVSVPVASVAGRPAFSLRKDSDPAADAYKTTMPHTPDKAPGFAPYTGSTSESSVQ